MPQPALLGRATALSQATAPASAPLTRKRMPQRWARRPSRCPQQPRPPRGPPPQQQVRAAGSWCCGGAVAAAKVWERTAAGPSAQPWLRSVAPASLARYLHAAPLPRPPPEPTNFETPLWLPWSRLPAAGAGAGDGGEEEEEPSSPLPDDPFNMDSQLATSTMHTLEVRLCVPLCASVPRLLVVGLHLAVGLLLCGGPAPT